MPEFNHKILQCHGTSVRSSIIYLSSDYELSAIQTSPSYEIHKFFKYAYNTIMLRTAFDSAFWWTMSCRNCISRSDDCSFVVYCIFFKRLSFLHLKLVVPSVVRWSTYHTTACIIEEFLTVLRGSLHQLIFIFVSSTENYSVMMW